jgi:hypothetical protein
MNRLVLFATALVLFISCGNKKEGNGDEDGGYSFEKFSGGFKEANVPYQLTDTALLKNKDTSSLKAIEFTSLIHDSLKNKIFGKSKVKYTPLAKIKVPDAETFLVVKASAGNKKAAILVIYDKNGEHGASFPFLVPDADPATSQVSLVEKSYVISKLVSKKSGTTSSDGKDVYTYDAVSKSLVLIMTDPLEEKTTVINPIDTLPRFNKYAGDYTSGKNALVSIRDGRTSKELMAFVHFRKNEGECVGELKGQLFFTSSTTAVYRQSGDPCIIQFSFKGSSVILKEENGCGNHRGIDCLFDGTYAKKKAPVKKRKTKS